MTPPPSKSWHYSSGKLHLHSIAEEEPLYREEEPLYRWRGATLSWRGASIAEEEPLYRWRGHSIVKEHKSWAMSFLQLICGIAHVMALSPSSFMSTHEHILQSIWFCEYLPEYRTAHIALGTLKTSSH